MPYTFSLDETTDVGMEAGSAVSIEYRPETSTFNGKIDWVKLEITGDDHSHLIDPAHIFNIAMSRQ